MLNHEAQAKLKQAVLDGKDTSSRFKDRSRKRHQRDEDKKFKIWKTSYCVEKIT